VPANWLFDCFSTASLP